MIPKVAYFYWGGKALSFLRYISVLSFRICNPDWKIVIYTPTIPVETQSWNDCWCNKPNFRDCDFKTNFIDTFDLVKKIPNLEVVKFDMETIGFGNNLSEVFKADIVRLWLMSTFGGLWSDIDILYFKPIAGVFNDSTTASFCFREGGVGGPAYHSVGLLAGAPGNPYYKLLFEKVKDYLDTRIYQSMGSFFYRDFIKPDHNKFIDDKWPGMFNIDIDLVYPIRVPVCIFKSPTNEMLPFLKDYSIGIHWYGGAPDAMTYQDLMTESRWCEYDNILTSLMKSHLHL